MLVYFYDNTFEGLLSAVFEKLFLALLDRAVARVLGEEGV